jgi:hypothetical protein
VSTAGHAPISAADARDPAYREGLLAHTASKLTALAEHVDRMPPGLVNDEVQGMAHSLTVLDGEVRATGAAPLLDDATHHVWAQHWARLRP